MYHRDRPTSMIFTYLAESNGYMIERTDSNDRVIERIGPFASRREVYCFMEDEYSLSLANNCKVYQISSPYPQVPSTAHERESLQEAFDSFMSQTPPDDEYTTV
jgi:hypothetical protein